MVNLDAWLLPLARLLPPETAHDMAIAALEHGWLPAQSVPAFPSLAVSLWGLNFANPIGLAAGFDKNARAVNGLLAQGFGFIEVGTVTPRPQPGNPKPRLFRLAEDKAIINRLGFNNEGVTACAERVAQCKRKNGGIVGVNIGRNKDSAEAIADYIQALQGVYSVADYVTVNISSPNTQGLRQLQERQALGELLDAVLQTRRMLIERTSRHVPLLVKIAPDMNRDQLTDAAEVIQQRGIDGVIVSNTTISRPETLRSAYQIEQGGLSGAPLFALSTRTLADFYKLTHGRIPLIGVGGISTPEEAYMKILHGASLIQLYTAFIYQGFGLVKRLAKGLSAQLTRDGFTSISQAVGAAIK